MDTKKRIQFGSRYLVDETAVFNHNAWDHVKWSEEQEEKAKETVKLQSLLPVAAENAALLLTSPAGQWDAFYSIHQDKFFKKRNWLLTEFPELSCDTLDPEAHIKVLDVGCGVGDTTFPLLRSSGGKMIVYCCDYSSKAIDIVQSNEQYDPKSCISFVWNICDDIPKDIPLESLDFVLCIYVLSAIPPEKHHLALKNLVKLMKPGGMLLFKDYGVYDLTQLRFKGGRFIKKNFYCRGDGTLVYYFTQDELDNLFTAANLVKSVNIVDRRLIVNRAKQLKMYRIWIQCKYVKVE